MSYTAKCQHCGVPIYMEDYFDEEDGRVCETCSDTIGSLPDPSPSQNSNEGDEV